MKLFVVLLVLVFSSVGFSQVVEDQAKELANSMLKHEAAIPLYKEDLAAMKSGRINRSIRGRFLVTESKGKKRYQFQSARIKDEFVERKERFIKEPDLFKIEKVQNLKQKSTVSIRAEDGEPYVFQVMQIIDDRNCLIKCLANDEWFWLRRNNTNTKEGEKFSLPEVVYISGRRQYATAGQSTKTVLEIEIADVAAIEKRAKEILEELKKSKCD